MKRIALLFVMLLSGVCLSVADSLSGDSCEVYITDIREKSDGLVASTNLPPGTYLLTVETVGGETVREAVLQRTSESSRCPLLWIGGGVFVLLFVLFLRWFEKRKLREEPLSSASEEVAPEVTEDKETEISTPASFDGVNQPLEVSAEPESCQTAWAQSDQRLFERAVNYIENNLSRCDLSVEELSRSLGMSRVHLYKKLLAVSGKSPVELIRVLRLKRAEQLLCEGELSISEVANRVGIHNPKYFTKYFREEYGIPPSAYQKQKKE